jgi:transposase-like protein
MTFKKALASNGFKTHNNKSKELVASKFHSTLRNVRIVVNTATDKTTGKPIAGKQAHFKAVFINNQSHWRTIASGGAFKGTNSFGSYLKAIEVAATSGPTCKCGAKKFKAKSGNVVCANACWANNGWGRKQKKWQGTKKKTSQSRVASRTPAQQKQLRADSLAKQKAEKKAQEKIDATKYATFVPGQLVKIIEPQQDTLANFIGTVTKVETVSNRPNDLLKNVYVMWMHSGETSKHHNYNPGTDTATYLVSVA